MNRNTPIQMGPMRKPLSRADKSSLAIFAQSAKRRGLIVSITETPESVTYFARESTIQPTQASAHAAQER